MKNCPTHPFHVKIKKITSRYSGSRLQKMLPLQLKTERKLEPAHETLSAEPPKLATVVSMSGSKTIGALVEHRWKHPKYGYIEYKYTKYLVHDENEVCQPGDLIQIQHCRPISKRKHFAVKQVLLSINDKKSQGLPKRAADAEDLFKGLDELALERYEKNYQEYVTKVKQKEEVRLRMLNDMKLVEGKLRDVKSQLLQTAEASDARLAQQTIDNVLGTERAVEDVKKMIQDVRDREQLDYEESHEVKSLLEPKTMYDIFERSKEIDQQQFADWKKMMKKEAESDLELEEQYLQFQEEMRLKLAKRERLQTTLSRYRQLFRIPDNVRKEDIEQEYLEYKNYYVKLEHEEALKQRAREAEQDEPSKESASSSADEPNQQGGTDPSKE